MSTSTQVGSAANMVASCEKAVKSNRRSIWYNLGTLYLFTKGDLKSIVVPQSIFAISVVFSSAGLVDTAYELNLWLTLSRIPLMVLWLWVNLLIEDISNQRLPDAIAEDTVNKPWRPIPSGRLSGEEAQKILRTLIPVSLLTSALLQSFEPSVTFTTLVWLYNDLDGASAGPLQRNILNAAGFACFGWGAIATLSGSSKDVGCNTVLIYWIAMTAATVMTTIHAQDFPDVDGDKIRGRRTIPLVFNETWARGTLAGLVLFWSIACLRFWNVNSTLAWMAVLGMGVTISLNTTLNRTHSSDKFVWKLWCFWMTSVYFLPLFSTGPLL